MRAGVAVALAGAISACAGTATGTGSGRPSTPATLRIVTPEAGARTGPDVDVRVRLAGGRIVSGSGGGTPDPREGHVHMTLDGKLVAMSYELRSRLQALAPGEHTVRAEFVAADHLPFASPVTATVTFTAGAPAGSTAPTAGG